MTASRPPLADWTPRRVGRAEIAAGAIPAATRFRGHAHEGVHLCGVIAGGFVETERKTSETAGPGTVRVSPSGRHAIEFGPEGARCVVIDLAPDEADVLGALDRAAFFRDPWLARIIAGLGALVADPAPGSVVALDGLLAELLAQVARRRGARRSRRPPPWLEAARERVHDLHGLPTLGELAASIGVHRAHLARAFRDHYGVTVGGYARRLRVECAVRLLGDEDRPLADIAAEAGFADQSHMTRAVAGATGRTPGRLRRAGRATPVQDGRASPRASSRARPAHPIRRSVP